MAAKKVNSTKAVKPLPKPVVASFKGSQLLRMDKYNNRIARIVIEADKDYSFVEADELIANYLKREDDKKC